MLFLRKLEQVGCEKAAEAVGCSIGPVMSRPFCARPKMAALLTGLEKEDLRCWAGMHS